MSRAITHHAGSPPPPAQGQAYRPVSAADLDRDLDRARRLADWLDSKFSIGGFRFGLDALVGLIPGVGDVATTLVGIYPLWVAKRHGFGKGVRARMAVNLFIDWLIGLVPLVGDVADFGFRAHAKNLKLLEKAAARHQA